MRGAPPKGSWGTGYIIEPRPNQKRISCSFCKHYNEDGSCMAKPIVISEVGYDYWKYCNSFYLDDDYDTPKNRANVERVKKAKGIYSQQDRTASEKKQQAELPRKKKNKTKHKRITKRIQLGTVVRVRDITYDEIVLYELVKSEDSNVISGKISIDSPVGQGLIGASEGEVCSIDTPNGMVKYKVLKIK
ncbi:MAG TPA: hypothetical protein GX707_03340 [Epulopiscium sp.]|nr:hypothetical protein [Candidatus Epulonipiscium sp.]